MENSDAAARVRIAFPIAAKDQIPVMVWLFRTSVCYRQQRDLAVVLELKRDIQIVFLALNQLNRRL